MYMLNAPPSPQNVPPDPTKYDLVWGQEYPCLRIKPEGLRAVQCRGKMERTSKRAYRFDGELWHHYKCNRCGREADDHKARSATADDKKVRDARTSTA